MENLLLHYERELALLRRYASEFAARYPKIAARLAISAERSEDAHVERMLQSFAFLGARIDSRLEDDYPEFTDALLEPLYPEYLRAFPSCSVAQFGITGRFQQLTEPVTVPRLTELETPLSAYRFRTAYGVRLAPIEVLSARYSSPTSVPAIAQLPTDTTGILSVTFGAAMEDGVLDGRIAGVARIYLHGEPPLIAALTDALLLRTSSAFVEGETGGVWKPLSRVPVKEVGFAADDALIDTTGSSRAGVRLLLEYFAFPDKFDFVDVDFVALARAVGPSRRLTLHLAIRGMPADSQPARAMEALTAANLKLFCTPVVNLFEREAEPLQLTASTVSYPVVPHTLQASAIEVYSIDSVYMAEQTAAGKTRIEIPAYRSLSHGVAHENAGIYWVANRDEQIALQQPGYETQLSLVDVDSKRVLPDIRQIGVDITCMNRNAATVLPFGSPDGDLFNEGASLSCPITMLKRPTAPVRTQRERGALWRLISQMTAHPLALGSAGLAGLKYLLRQHAGSLSASSRHIDGIVGLDGQTVMRRMPVKPFPAFVRGIEIRLTVDEAAFTGRSLAIFAGVMDRMFAPCAHMNSFVEVVLLSKGSGAEIRRCSPRQGTSPSL